MIFDKFVTKTLWSPWDALLSNDQQAYFLQVQPQKQDESRFIWIKICFIWRLLKLLEDRLKPPQKIRSVL